jgi:hypothetical protein
MSPMQSNSIYSLIKHSNVKNLNQSIIILASILTLAFASCKKDEVAQSNNENSSHALSTASANAPEAASVYHATYQINDESYNWNPCTNEWVHFTGDAQIVFDYVINNNMVSGVYHYNPQGEKGEGLSSGIIYQGTGSFTQSFSASLINGSSTYNEAIKIPLIAPGRGNNLVWTIIFHVIINSNGELEVQKLNDSLTCQ